jgi:hypothetical protein
VVHFTLREKKAEMAASSATLLFNCNIITMDEQRTVLRTAEEISDVDVEEDGSLTPSTALQKIHNQSAVILIEDTFISYLGLWENMKGIYEFGLLFFFLLLFLGKH